MMCKSHERLRTVRWDDRCTTTDASAREGSCWKRALSAYMIVSSTCAAFTACQMGTQQRLNLMQNVARTITASAVCHAGHEEQDSPGASLVERYSS